MCFGKKDDSSENKPRPVPIPTQQDSKMSYPQQHSYAPPSGPPPPQQQQHYPPPSGTPSGQQQQYAPPPGPPPDQNQQQYAPPPGPPPQQGFTPPAGPPPGRYDPPPGPPPSDYTAAPPGPPPGDKKPLHDWEIAVPDTSLFPPPPAFFQGWDRSPAHNSTEELAKKGEEYVHNNPLVGPVVLDAVAVEALQSNNFRLLQPWGFNGELNWRSVGCWEVRTRPGVYDSSILTYPPMYAETLHSPLRTGRKHTIYYEVKVDPGNNKEVTLAMGYTALPYPNFRCPGWHRGSLGVHGDDGHRFVNDRWGGISFTDPFRPGDTYGIGMVFEPPTFPGGRIEVKCFLTRNGQYAGEWDIHEEQDANATMSVTGMEGYHDMAGAVGTFEQVEFEVVFDPAKWRYRPA